MKNFAVNFTTNMVRTMLTFTLALFVTGGALPAAAGTGYETKADEAVFWSGLGKGGDKLAAAYASSCISNAMTLEQLLVKRAIVLPPWAQDQEAWKTASLNFAHGSSGTVHAVLGTPRVDSVWLTVEFVELKSNPGIDKVVKVDASDTSCISRCDCAKTTLYSK